MGGGASQEQAAKSGWRIMKVFNDSPCAKCDMVPHFDVLTHVNGIKLSAHPLSLTQLLQEGVPTKLTITNFSIGNSREVVVTPNSQWGGTGLLGLVIRYDAWVHAEEQLIRILAVHPGGPADAAGLEAKEDYLLGTAEIAFQSYAELEYFLDKFESKLTSMFVFNLRTCTVREVWIKPDSLWNGEGSLGCDVERSSLPKNKINAVNKAESLETKSDLTPALQQPLDQTAQQSQPGTNQQSSSVPTTGQPINDQQSQATTPSDYGHVAVDQSKYQQTLDPGRSISFGGASETKAEHKRRQTPSH
eukprot:gb/GEZN01012633.1/.p1 GENE.gb/GEZN01012633.1/~~gb/GEZN01012633.1/.p1  ORF type:complete len:303 (-),score=43.91 gb/GEZN01012633.1/:75-983(-)